MLRDLQLPRVSWPETKNEESELLVVRVLKAKDNQRGSECLGSPLESRSGNDETRHRVGRDLE